MFYIIPSFTHSSLVLNLNGFISSAEHKLYFEEQLLVLSDSDLFSQWGPATVLFVVVIFHIQHFQM